MLQEIDVGPQFPSLYNFSDYIDSQQTVKRIAQLERDVAQLKVLAVDGTNIVTRVARIEEQLHSLTQLIHRYLIQTEVGGKENAHLEGGAIE